MYDTESKFTSGNGCAKWERDGQSFVNILVPMAQRMPQHNMMLVRDNINYFPCHVATCPNVLLMLLKDRNHKPVTYKRDETIKSGLCPRD